MALAKGVGARDPCDTVCRRRAAIAIGAPCAPWDEGDTRKKILRI